MNASRTCPQPRADLVTQSCNGLSPEGVAVFDPVSQQRWHLSPVESLVWHRVCHAQASDMATWVKSVCEQHPDQLTAARVWAALDALADRGLLLGRATPPAAEAVTHHHRLNRRQWAVAGLAMAAAPAAFAATAAAAEEKAKADVQAPPAEDAQAKRRQEQETKKAERAMQEEKQKDQRSAEQAQKRDAQNEAGASRAQEQQQKRAVRQQEEESKQSSRKAEQERKRHQSTKEKAQDEAPKPF